MKEAALCLNIMFRVAIAAGAVLSAFHGAFAAITADSYIQDGLAVQFAGGANAEDGTVYWGDLPLPGMMLFLR